MSWFKTSVVNLLLRGMTLGSKFLLLIFVARFLSPEDLGIWGLMNATIAISLYVLGLDFYVFNTREILAVEETKRVPLIRDQIVFHGLVYIVVLPMLLSIFIMKLIPWSYVGWFYALVVLEHLSQESARFLATISRSTMANLALFFRSGAWIYVVISAMYYQDNVRELRFIWSGWIVGILCSIFLTIHTLRSMPWNKLRTIPINWKWMRHGLTVSLPFFCGTLGFVGIQYTDRYFIQHYWGEAMVGVYTFYASIASVIHVFIFTGIVMILYPRIISLYSTGQIAKYRAVMKQMGLGIIASVAVLTTIALLLIGPVLQVVENQLFNESLDIFWLLLLAVAFLCASYIPHYSLFVRKNDRAIITSSAISVLVALSANYMLVPTYGLKGAAIASLCAMVSMFLAKSSFALMHTNT